MNQENVGLFLDTTQIWEEYLQAAQGEVDNKELFLRLYQNINKIVIALNLKDSAIYTQTEFVNGQTWCPIDEITNFVGVVGSASSELNAEPRQVYRKIVFCGALLNALTKTVPHNITITDTLSFTRIYGTANNKAGKVYLPLPYVDAVNPVSISIIGANISITTISPMTAYTESWVVLEYIKL